MSNEMSVLRYVLVRARNDRTRLIDPLPKSIRPQVDEVHRDGPPRPGPPSSCTPHPPPSIAFSSSHTHTHLLVLVHLLASLKTHLFPPPSQAPEPHSPPSAGHHELARPGRARSRGQYALPSPRNPPKCLPGTHRYTLHPLLLLLLLRTLSPPRLPFPFPPAPPTRTVHLPSTIYHPRPLPPPFRTPP